MEYCKKAPLDKQPPDYYVEGEPYWFFRYFKEQPDVDVLDISSCKWLESFEKNKFRFYIWQALKAIPKLNKYDLVISHGMQSGVVVSLWRRIFKTKAKHIVFDIGAFNSASESGMALKLMQHASRSIDGIIYHTSSQLQYYERFFSWIVNRSSFIRFGTDADFFTEFDKSNVNSANYTSYEEDTPFCLCIGYSKRDWDTVIKAFQLAKAEKLILKMIGHVDPAFENISGVEQVGYISIKELMNEIRRSKFGILPLKSYNYSYGQMTLMQQMAMGKCVITSQVPSLVDYVKNEETAVLYEPENYKQLAEMINKINENDLLRQRIGDSAKAYIQNECNEKVMARAVEKFIEEKVILKEG